MYARHEDIRLRLQGAREDVSNILVELTIKYEKGYK